MIWLGLFVLFCLGAATLLFEGLSLPILRDANHSHPRASNCL